MSTPILIGLVLLGLCGHACDASRDRKIYKKLNSFKASMRDEIRFLRDDITTLFDTLNNLTLTKEPVLPTVKDGNDASVRLVALEDNLKTIGNTVERLGGKYSRLVYAFSSNLTDIYQGIADNTIEVSVLKTESLEVKAQIASNTADIYQRIDDNKKDILKEMSVLVKEILEDKVEKVIIRKLNEHLTPTKEINADNVSINNAVEQNVGSLPVGTTVQPAHSVDLPVGTTVQPAHNEDLPVRTKEQSAHSVPVGTTEPTALVCGKGNGSRSIYVDSISSVTSVYCDREADSEMWITFMRRENGQVNFTKSWAEYKHGFGRADGEFWSGNEVLHQLTADKPLRLRIDMADFEGNKAVAEYKTFQVGTERDGYRLTVGGYSGNAGDSLANSTYHIHSGMMFSTLDSDNDKADYHCARAFLAGWWFNDCFMSNLNGVYHNQSRIDADKGIHWYTWTGWKRALESVEMKVR